MTVMLLQRFAASHSAYVTKPNNNTCDYNIGNCQLVDRQLTLVIDEQSEEDNYKEESVIDKCYCSNINNNNSNNSIIINSSSSKNNNYNYIKNFKKNFTNNLINLNNNNNNRTNNSSYTDKEKVINATNNCKNEKTSRDNSCSSGCCGNRQLINYQNSNNEATESDELLGREKNNNPGRQETITSRTTTITTGTTGTQLTSATQSRYCSQGVVMRYYRLWIYACNIVLLGSAIGFAAAVSRTLFFTSDPRRYLVPGVPRPYDPTALYGYLAICTQLGLVQLLGCIAARRLSAKLLNAYWYLLLALLLGDVVIGLAWIFKFERMRSDLKPALKLRLQLDYGRELTFTDNWDRLQRDFSCCGVIGPNDFDSRFLPESCCSQLAIIQITNDTIGCQKPFINGCEESLMGWLRNTGDLLFVFGLCVIAFSKLIFLCILKCEIREMIQKIRLLREPPPPASSAFIQSLCQPTALPTAAVTHMTTTPTAATTTTTTTTTTNTSCTAAGACGDPTICGNNLMNYIGGPRRTTLPIVVSSSTSINNNPSSFGNNVLNQQLDQDHGVKHPLLYTSNLQQDNGADSDTNSHCALILEESTPTSTARHNCNSTQREKNNGNNNYEMREFNRRYLMSNGGSPTAGITIVGQNRRT